MMGLGQLDIFITGVVYIAAIFVLFFVGKLLYDRLRPGFSMRQELFEHDNLAMAISVVGYYFGLILALGGVLAGDSGGLESDLIDIGMFGLLAVILLNISNIVNRKLVFRAFDIEKEIIKDRNVGTGAIEAGHHIASGLIVAGAVTGEGSNLVVSLVFWALGQLALVLVVQAYQWTTSFDLHGEIERDNVAVGVATAGLLIAVGNLVRLSISGAFTGWAQDLMGFALYLVVGLLILPVTRLITDKLLVPGVKLNDEMIHQEHPNVGAGFIEAFSYVAASMLIGWAIY